MESRLLLPTAEECLNLTKEQCQQIQGYFDPDEIRANRNWEYEHQTELIRLYMTGMTFPLMEHTMKPKLGWSYKTYSNRFRDWLFPLDRLQRENAIVRVYSIVSESQNSSAAIRGQVLSPLSMLSLEHLQQARNPNLAPNFSPNFSRPLTLSDEFRRSNEDDRLSISTTHTFMSRSSATTTDSWTSGSSVASSYANADKGRVSIASSTSPTVQHSSLELLEILKSIRSTQPYCIRPSSHNPRTGLWNGILRVIPCINDHSQLRWDDSFLSCSVCGFSRWHALMVHAGTINIQVVKATLNTLGSVERVDFAGNHPIHFLMASGARIEHLAQLILIDEYGQNIFGQNPLHVLDPRNLGDALIDLLELFKSLGEERDRGLLLTQRDINCRLPLHSLLQYPFHQITYRRILKLFPFVNHQLRTLDSSGRTVLKVMDDAAKKLTPESVAEFANIQVGITEIKEFLFEEGTSKLSQYGFHDIARGARGISFIGFFQCRICNEVNGHSNSYLEQMLCAVRQGCDRNAPDKTGMTPAHLLITQKRCNNNDPENEPETPAQTAQLFRILIPPGDRNLREALHVLDPDGNSLTYNIAIRGLSEILEYVLSLEDPPRRYLMVNSRGKSSNGEYWSVLQAVNAARGKEQDSAAWFDIPWFDIPWFDDTRRAKRSYDEMASRFRDVARILQREGAKIDGDDKLPRSYHVMSTVSEESQSIDMSSTSHELRRPLSNSPILQPDDPEESSQSPASEPAQSIEPDINIDPSKMSNFEYDWSPYLPRIICLYKTGIPIPQIHQLIQAPENGFEPRLSTVYQELNSRGYPTDHAKRMKVLSSVKIIRGPSENMKEVIHLNPYVLDDLPTTASGTVPLVQSQPLRSQTIVEYASQDSIHQRDHSNLTTDRGKYLTTSAGISPPVSRTRSRQTARLFPIDPVIDEVLISAWKEVILPTIEPLVRDGGDSSISISLLRQGNNIDDSQPVIRIQTSKPRTEKQRADIRASVSLKLCPLAVPVPALVFATGSVRRTAQRSDLDVMPCLAQNTAFSLQPPMGVSIGVGGSVEDTATLGGYIRIDGVPHILTVHHLFTNEDTNTIYEAGTAITQPSLQEVKEFGALWERMRLNGEPLHLTCVKNIFGKIKESLPLFSFGSLAHSSGYRNRCSRDGASSVEMDWAICKVDDKRIGFNITPCGGNLCGSASVVNPDRSVFSVGRTSGRQDGIINPCTTYLILMNDDGTHRQSDEWAILRPDVTPEETWISAGMGVSGDSGAWILEHETNNVVGQLWGRDYQEGEEESDGEIITYFTPILEIFDDIRDRCGAKDVAISTDDDNSYLEMATARSVPNTGLLQWPAQPSPSENICRICNCNVSVSEAQQYFDGLEKEIALLKKAALENQLLFLGQALTPPKEICLKETLSPSV